MKLRKSNGGRIKRQTEEQDSEDQAGSEAVEIVNDNKGELMPPQVKKLVDQRAFDSTKDPECK